VGEQRAAVFRWRRRLKKREREREREREKREERGSTMMASTPSELKTFHQKTSSAPLLLFPSRTHLSRSETSCLRSLLCVEGGIAVGIQLGRAFFFYRAARIARRPIFFLAAGIITRLSPPRDSFSPFFLLPFLLLPVRQITPNVGQVRWSEIASRKREKERERRKKKSRAKKRLPGLSPCRLCLSPFSHLALFRALLSPLRADRLIFLSLQKKYITKTGPF